MTDRRWIRAASKAMASLGLFLMLLAPLQGVLQVSVAYAQTAGSGGAPATEPPAGSVGNTSQQAQHDAQAKNDDFCSGPGSTASTCLSGIIYLFAVYIPSNFAYITAQVFNFGVQLALNSASYALQFLSQGWAVVRDIANLAFIFILIYIAYTLIFQAETAGTMQTLAWVIVMALLINFSFFISRVVIDAGNILAVQFYNAINITDPTGQNPNPVIASPLGGSLQQTTVKDLTAGLMNVTQVQGILSDASFQKFMHRNDNQSGPGTFFTNLGILSLVFIAIGILFALLGFVFLMVGIKFLVRIVILWFAIIAAPLAFAARALPGNRQMAGYYHMWEKHLVQSSFYPAVFLFLFYIMTLFTNAMAGTNGLIPSIFNAANSQSNLAAVSVIANVVIRVGLIVVLLFYAMKFSDSFSEEGSAAARSVVSWAGNKAAGATGWVGRRTVGAGAGALAQTQTVRNFAARSAVGSMTLTGLKGIAGSSLDVRGVSGLKNLAAKGGIDLKGPSGKGGYAKQEADRAKAFEARAKNLKSDMTYVKENALSVGEEEHDRTHKEGEKVADLRKIVNEGAEATQKNIETKYDQEHGAGAYQRRIEEFTKQKDMSQKRAQEFEALGEKTGATRERENMARAAENITSMQTAGQRAHEQATKDLSGLTKLGENKIKELDKTRIERYAQRLETRSVTNPVVSRGDIEGASKVRKVASGKTTKEEALEHLLHAAHEEEAEAHADEHAQETHPAPAAHAPAAASGGGHTETHGDGHNNQGGGGQHHLTLAGVKAAAVTSGGNAGAENMVAKKISERLAANERFQEAMLEEAKKQGADINAIKKAAQAQTEKLGDITMGEPAANRPQRNISRTPEGGVGLSQRTPFGAANTSPKTPPQQPPAQNTQPPKPPQTPPPTNPGQNPEKK